MVYWEVLERLKLGAASSVLPGVISCRLYCLLLDMWIFQNLDNSRSCHLVCIIYVEFIFCFGATAVWDSIFGSKFMEFSCYMTEWYCLHCHKRIILAIWWIFYFLTWFWYLWLIHQCIRRNVADALFSFMVVPEILFCI